MKIFVDYTTIKAGKRYDPHNPITAAFNSITNGILASGGKHAVALTPVNADVVVVFGSHTKRKPDTESAMSIASHQRDGRKILSLDSALFSTYIRRHLNSSETMMFRVGLNDCTGEGDFLNENSTPSRYEWLKKQFNFTEGAPQSDNSKPILFALQSEKGWTYDEERPYYEAAREIISDIRRRTDRTIILKPHPNTDRHPIEWIYEGFDNIEVVRQDRSRRDLIDDLKGVGAFVTHSSSAACESYVEGIPTFTLNERCVVYKDCEKTLDKINNLEEINWTKRQQTLYDWSMTSWHIKEFENPALIHYYLSKVENTL